MLNSTIFHFYYILNHWGPFLGVYDLFVIMGPYRSSGQSRAKTPEQIQSKFVVCRTPLGSFSNFWNQVEIWAEEFPNQIENLPSRIGNLPNQIYSFSYTIWLGKFLVGR